MFDIFPDVTQPPLRRQRSGEAIQLGPDRWLPPNLVGDDKAYLVELIGADDPLDAKNWSFKRKLATAGALGFDTLVASWGSSAFSAAVAPIVAEYDIGMTTAILGISLYIVGFATGPLAWAPVSELYGRKLPVVLGKLIFVCFIFGAGAAQNVAGIMLCRFFAGVFASAPLTIVGAAFGDMFSNATRGIAIAAFSLLVFAGPFVSPICSAFIAQSYLGWRWTQYLTGIMGGAALVLDVLFIEETHQKTLLRKRAHNIRLDTHNWAIHHESEEASTDFKDILHKNLLLPMRLLVTEPVCFLLTIYSAVIYGILYLFLEAYPIVFVGKHGFTEAEATLPYVGLLVGVFAGAGVVIAFEPRYDRKLRAAGGLPQPRERYIPMQIGAILLTLGLFWFAWTGNYPQVHWLAPAFSGVLTGAGILIVFLQVLNALIDTYLVVAASAIAANTFLRSLFGAGFPLFATQMFENLGVQWAGSLLGFIALALAPIPLLFYIYDERIRASSKYAPKLGKGKKDDGPSSDRNDNGPGNEDDLEKQQHRRQRPDADGLQSSDRTV